MITILGAARGTLLEAYSTQQQVLDDVNADVAWLNDALKAQRPLTPEKLPAILRKIAQRVLEILDRAQLGGQT